MEKKKRTKKYPILRYLSYLVIVGILLTGVSLARYSGATSGGVSTPLSRFLCSYEISDASSLIFSNSDYWLDLGEEGLSATNTARTVRFTLRNYLADEEGGADRISDVALQSTLRFYAPAQFAGGLAVQVAEVEEDGGYTVVTPQYVLRDLIYEVSVGADGKYEAGGSFASGERTVNTALSEDYSDRTDGLSGTGNIEQQLTVTGGFTGTADGSHTGSITAAAGDGTSIGIASAVRTASYSVGFVRTEVQGEEVGSGTAGVMAPVLYIDCEKEMSFYTVDLTLPEALFSAGQAEEKEFVLFLTVTEQIDDTDFNSVWNTDGTDGAEGTGSVGGDGVTSWDGLLVEPAAGAAPYTLNGATVTGYHFTRDLPVYGLADGVLTESGETTVRINKVYDYENGGATLFYEHVAPVSEAAGSASVDHPIETFYSYENGAFTETSAAFSSVAGVHGLYGTCVNVGADGEPKSGYSFFDGLSDDPYYDTYAEQQAKGTRKYSLSLATSKGYSTVLSVLFAQASESAPAGEGSA